MMDLNTSQTKLDTIIRGLEGDDWDQDPSSWSASTVSFIQENDISFALDINNEPPFISEARRDRELLISELEKILRSFKKFNISYSLIKFPYIPKPIGDVDILIPSRVNRRKAFENIGFELDNRTEPHREAYTKQIGDDLITFDVHTRASWRRVEYLDAAKIVEKHITHTLPDGTDCYVPRPEHELLIMAAHSMFDERSVSLFESLYGYNLINNTELDMQYSRSIAKQYNWVEVFDRFCEISRSVGTNHSEIDPLSLPLQLSTREVVESRMRKVVKDASSARVTTVGREFIGYPQDVVVHIFEDQLGVSLYPFFKRVTRVKRAIKENQTGK